MTIPTTPLSNFPMQSEVLQNNRFTQPWIVFLQRLYMRVGSSDAPSNIELANAIQDNIVGPASSVDGDVPVFTGATGKIVRDSGVLLTSLAPLLSPNFTGAPTAPTPAPGDSSSLLATTAFVAGATANAVSGPASSTNNDIALFNGTTGKVIKDSGVLLSSLDTVAAAVARFASPPALGSTTPAAVSATTITASSTITPSQTAGVVGTTTNNNVNAGSVGEYQTANTLTTAATSTVTLNATSISLTAGDWDVAGIVQFNPAGTTVTQLVIAGISTTSATFVSTPFVQAQAIATGNAAGITNIINAPVTRISLASTTTVYLLAQATFSVSTMTVHGLIRARRIR